MPDETKKPAGVPVGAAERRQHPRYKFTGVVEITDEKSGIQTKARVIDIGRRGCFVESDRALSLGTETTLRINKDTDAFEVQARVVHSGARGMGFLFTAVAQEQLQIVEGWLGPFRQQEWLALHRRRTQRVLVQVPVRVSGQNRVGSRFQEETQTLVINANGALILLSASLNQGQTVSLVNMAAQETAECVVAYLGQRQGQRLEVGVGFLLPNPKFWRVAFPPMDWTRPLE